MSVDESLGENVTAVGDTDFSSDTTVETHSQLFSFENIKCRSFSLEQHELITTELFRPHGDLASTWIGWNGVDNLSAVPGETVVGGGDNMSCYGANICCKTQDEDQEQEDTDDEMIIFKSEDEELLLEHDLSSSSSSELDLHHQPPHQPLSSASIISLHHQPPSSASIIRLYHQPLSSASIISLYHQPPSSASIISLHHHANHAHVRPR